MSPKFPTITLLIGLFAGCAEQCPLVDNAPKPGHAIYVTDTVFPVQFAVPDTVRLHYQGCKECSGGKSVSWVVNEEHCGNAAPDFYLNMERNDTISASACRSWTIDEEQARCGPSTLETWRLYDCNYETKEECLTGSSWYRIAYFSFYEKPKGSEAIYYNGYSVTIFKDGLVLDGAIKYVCSEPMDVRPKQQWMLSWLKAIKILTEEEWKDSLRRVEK